MDLFTPIVPESQQHQNFRMIAYPGLCEPEIAVIKDWASGFVDRDGKFVKEFQKTFNSSFWELYLFACFKALGCRVDFTHASPDFLVESMHNVFIAEATTANQAKDFCPEWERDVSPEALTKLDILEVLRLATIRLTNAITTKHKKYRSSYANLAHVKGKPFVVCIAPFEQPFFFLQTSQALQRVLYAYGQPLFVEGSSQRERIIVGESRSYCVQKYPGTEIPLGLFTNAGMEDVSAVIFSSTATFGKVRALARRGSYPLFFQAVRYSKNNDKPNIVLAERGDYQETLLDGLHVCINPFAKIPLDFELFTGREVTIHSYEPQIKEYLVEPPDGFLIQRTCMSLIPENLIPQNEFDPRKSADSQSKAYKELTPEVWTEAQLVPVGGYSGLFHDNHMAHYQGWTIVVAFDITDRDWGAQAVKGLYFNLPQFMQANNRLDVAYIGTTSWFPSKEEAFAEILHRIDEIITEGKT